MTSHASRAEAALQQFETRFGGSGSGPPLVLSAPGRVNLIGEHIDYHDLPVLPMAIQRRIWIAFRPRRDTRVRAVSSGEYGEREFLLHEQEPSAPGDWVNYLKAAAQAVSSRWPLARGVDAVIASDLPAAAGLSSSSALLVGFTLALLEANSILATNQELMDILPEGEQFVGTRGGAMDHAVILAARAGSALLVRFAPLALTPLPVPREWSFLVAHSLTIAEKSAGARVEYNARRAAGEQAVVSIGFESYRSALEQLPLNDLRVLAQRALEENRITDEQRRAFLHVINETRRVDEAVAALRRSDAETFGHLLVDSHASLRDDLRVSSPALDELVEKAAEAGALGARLTGAGFGGCAVVLCRTVERDRVRRRLIESYYSKRHEFNADQHLIVAEPSAGALYDTSLLATASQTHFGVSS